MKKFLVKFKTADNNNIIPMYVNCDDITDTLKIVEKNFKVTEVKSIKQVDNDTLL